MSYNDFLKGIVITVERDVQNHNCINNGGNHGGKELSFDVLVLFLGV